MLDVATVELTVLEAMLDAEVGCQARHEDIEEPCSVNVTHNLSHCLERGKPICLNAAVYTLACIMNKMNFCANNCGQSCADCWKVIAI